MTTNQRGCFSLLGFLLFAILFCVVPPFIFLPGQGQAVTLPVISVPAEYYLKGWPGLPIPGFDEIKNTMGGALMATIIVLAIAWVARSHSKGWTKEVPGKFQALIEMIVDALWGLTKQQAGNKPKVRNILFPIVASLFLYLLAGNWGKLVPGVETVGVLHCAAYEPVAFNGFPVMEANAFGRPYFILKSDRPLNTGTAGTYESYHRCEAMLGVSKYDSYLPKTIDPFLDKAVTYTVAEGDTLESIAEKFNTQVEEIRAGEIPQLSQYVALSYEGWGELSFTGEGILALNPTVEAAASSEGKEAEASHKLVLSGETTPEPAAAEATAEAHAADTHAEATAEAHAAETTTADAHAAEGAVTPATLLKAGQTITLRPEIIGAEATTLHNQLFTVSPFVRGMTTDLSFTLGLSIFAFLLIQAFGISELGIDYFQKFVNIRAIGNIANKPLGAIDFVVGIFEIVSEFGKIISLSFRLFGALFAGTVLFAVIMFLVGTTIPAVILLLEIIVGFAQAAVFAILTLIFCSQAMVSHHHEDDHGHGEHAEAH